MVREHVGPVAAFKLAVSVRGLPITRSGKIMRKSVADLARNKLKKVSMLNLSVLVLKKVFFQISGTVVDASVYTEIEEALRKLGFCQ